MQHPACGWQFRYVVSVRRSHPSYPKEKFSWGFPVERRRCRGEDLSSAWRKMRCFWFKMNFCFLSASQALGMNSWGRTYLRKREDPRIQISSYCTCLSLLQGTDRAIPVLIIGILVFLPGFYHLRIAYYASKGYRGYSYDDIPDFDD